MADIYRKMLAVLLDLLEVAFTSSSVNRKSLHEIEWEAEEGSPSILGEVEVRADSVIGIVRTCLKRQPESIHELIYTLEASSIYQSEILVNWLVRCGDGFPDYFRYMMAIENLRAGTIAFLKKEIKEGNGGGKRDTHNLT